MADTFCPIPWNFQAIRANGDIRVCCQSNISKDQGVLRGEDGKAFNARAGQLSGARNSELMKSVRQNMLKGEWSPSCLRCKQEEESNLSSRRKYELEQWSIRPEDVQPHTQGDGTIDTHTLPVRYYDLRFGNLCNLKCRMCGPTDSSAWYEDWVKLTGSHQFRDTSGTVTIQSRDGKLYSDEYSWHESEAFWISLEEQLDSVHHIYMAGGEPLLIKRHYDFLEKCVARNVAQQMILEYNTNCTQLPPKVLKLWTHFKQVRIGASIDGYGAFAEYQRYPSHWPSIYENLKTLNGLPSNILVWLAFTVTTYNVFHLTDFMKWKLKNSELKNINRTTRRPIITPHVAHNPKHLNVRVLPRELKEDLIADFRAMNEWVVQEGFSEPVQRQCQSITSSVTDYMRAQDYHDEYWKEFSSYTRKLDSIRGQNILDLVPKFSNYLS